MIGLYIKKLLVKRLYSDYQINEFLKIYHDLINNYNRIVSNIKLEGKSKYIFNKNVILLLITLYENNQVYLLKYMVIFMLYERVTTIEKLLINIIDFYKYHDSSNGLNKAFFKSINYDELLFTINKSKSIILPYLETDFKKIIILLCEVYDISFNKQVDNIQYLSIYYFITELISYIIFNDIIDYEKIEMVLNEIKNDQELFFERLSINGIEFQAEKYLCLLFEKNNYR